MTTAQQLKDTADWLISAAKGASGARRWQRVEELLNVTILVVRCLNGHGSPTGGPFTVAEFAEIENALQQFEVGDTKRVPLPALPAEEV